MIYAIFSGEYSDWTVHGYFKEPDDAYSYCEFHNSNDRLNDDYYVVEIPEMEVDFRERPNFHYIFEYSNSNDGGTVLLAVSTRKGGMLPNPVITHRSYNNLINGEPYIVYRITVYANDYDQDKVFKIVTDALAKYKAEHELE